MFIVLPITGMFIFLFIFWKRLKEDYLPNQIFSTFFYILFFTALSCFLSIKFLSNWWFWISFFGFILGLVISLFRFKLKFYETYEAAFLGLLILFSLYQLGDAVSNLNLISFFSFVVGMILIGLFQYVDMHYKNIGWYKSGKVGFTGLFMSAVFFLARAVASKFFPNILSFQPDYELYLSSVSSFFFLMLTYNLSRSQP